MVETLAWPYIEYVANLKRFIRQIGRRLTELREERGWSEEDFKKMKFNFESWKRHQRGDSGMSGPSCLKICEITGLKAHELLKGTDEGIYEKRPVVVRRRRRRVAGKKKDVHGD